MKKLLFLIAAIAFLASCSNVSENSDMSESTTTHKVKFNVKGFAVDKESFSKLDVELPYQGEYCEYSIYKADGTAIVAKVIDGIIENSLVIEEELPAGEYKIAVMYVSENTQHRFPIFKPENFNTDYCTGNQWVARLKDNRGIYFNTYNFTVTQHTELIDDIVLEPMWSQIDIKITDANECKLPEDANLVGYHIDPHFHGFSIKDKISTLSYKPAQSFDVPTYLCTTTSAFLTDNGIFDNVASGADEEITIRLVFMHHSIDDTYYVTNKIIYKGKIERGYQYTFTGALGDLRGESGNGTDVFHVKTSSLVTKEEIPFE